jgi:divalent metal cation (Fe/Co/Zn/Cd) transporter
MNIMVLRQTVLKENSAKQRSQGQDSIRLSGNGAATTPLKLLNFALLLAVITVVYNTAEGLFSTYFGVQDETLALLGFGIDSFVEVISGLGIMHMIYRMKRRPVERRDRFERNALRITGSGFFLLSIGLAIGSIINIVYQRAPETTLVGLVVAAVSIITMWLLIHFKLRVGKALRSDAIIADAHCTRACLYLSVILLVSSGLYEWLRIPYIDVIGSLGIAVLSFREGREAFQKARSDSLACGDDCCG